MALPIGTSLTAVVSPTSSTRNASPADAAESLNELQVTVSRLHGKIQQLKRTPTDDPLQRQQNEAIVDLYNAVAWIQRILWPTVEQLLLPGGGAIGAARDAAGGGGGGGGAGSAVAGKSALPTALARSPVVKRF